MYSSSLTSFYENGLITPLTVIPGHGDTPSSLADLTIIGHMRFGTFLPVLEHLACFAGGLIGMGAKVLYGSLEGGGAEYKKGWKGEKDMKTADGFTKLCFWSYNSSYTGLGPETQTFYGPQGLFFFYFFSSSLLRRTHLHTRGVLVNR